MTQYTINPYTGREVMIGGSTHRELFYSGAYDQKISGGAKHAAPCFDDEVMDRDGFCRKGNQRSSLEPAYFRGGSLMGGSFNEAKFQSMREKKTRKSRKSQQSGGSKFDLTKALADVEKKVSTSEFDEWIPTKKYIIDQYDHNQSEELVKQYLANWKKNKVFNGISGISYV